MSMRRDLAPSAVEVLAAIEEAEAVKGASPAGSLRRLEEWESSKQAAPAALSDLKAWLGGPASRFRFPSPPNPYNLVPKCWFASYRQVLVRPARAAEASAETRRAN
jgi:hypothetical protein